MTSPVMFEEVHTYRRTYIHRLHSCRILQRFLANSDVRNSDDSNRGAGLAWVTPPIAYIQTYIQTYIHT